MAEHTKGPAPLTEEEIARFTRRAYVVHEALIEWVSETFPREHAMTIAVACTYEIGRVITVLGADLTTAEREDLFRGLTAVMRDHITKGLTR